jgi:hypothetical protein
MTPPLKCMGNTSPKNGNKVPLFFRHIYASLVLEKENNGSKSEIC